MVFRTFPRFAACAVVLAARPLLAQGVPAPPLAVHAIWGSREFASDLVELSWMKDGKAYTAVEEDASGNTDLYRIDAATGTKQLLVRGAGLVPPGGRRPIAIEEYRFSGDGSKLLILTNSARVWRQNTKGTFFVWDSAARRLIPVSSKPGYQQFAKFSPDGRRVAFLRDNNIYVTDLASGAETGLTSDGGENVINGTSDWVYEEELDLRDAFRWSPDGSRIAFWRLDQSPIRPFYLQDFDSLYAQLVPVHYPKSGTPNSEVKIGVVELGTGRTSWIDLGPDRDIYVAAMDFADSADEVWLTRPLLRVGLDGKGLARIPSEPGTHAVEFDPTFTRYVDTYSRAGIPPVQTLRRANGALLRTVADNAKLAARVTALGLTRPEFITITTADGVQLNAWIIKPRGFDASRRYPLLMSVYGGPGSQTVTDSWSGPNYLWHQMLAQDGYLVASVDNRGTGGRGAKFMKLTYLHLGPYESADQIAAARWFATQGYVNPDRIGIWGWSYGGYMASRSMFLGAGVFKAALVGAPVTD